MQSLASYGSDSDESSSPSPPRRPPPVPSLPQSNPPLNPAPPVLNRLKSTGNGSQLSGVVSTTTPQRRPTKPSPSRRRGSTSPPPHASASAPRSTLETRTRNHDEVDRDETSSTTTPLRTDDDDVCEEQDREENSTRSTNRRERERELGQDDEQSRGSTSTTTTVVDLFSLTRFGIPPIPTGPCNPAVQAKLNNFDSLRRSRNLHFNDSLSSSKAFRNPRIYTKLVEFMDVDETGTCFDRDVWDSKRIGRDGQASRLAELQKLKSEAKQASVGQPNSRTSINFTSSSTNTTSGSTMKGGGDMASRYRERDERDREKNGKRSRWDTAGGASTTRERSKSPRSRRR